MEVTSMSNMPLRIVKLIRQNQQQSDPILDLSDEYLSEVPIEILELTHLEKLLLSGNHIWVIPETLRQLPKLSWLDIRYNPIEQLADLKGLVLDYIDYLAHHASLTPAHINSSPLR